MDGTTMYVPNSFFLYKPMVNFSQRPKRDIDIRFRVSSTTPVETLRRCLARLEAMLHSLHMGLTSHEENQSDLRHGEKWERFCYVAMEDLFEIHVFSYTDELDERKYSMIRSEVWLAIMEIVEELNIETVSDDISVSPARVTSVASPSSPRVGAQPDEALNGGNQSAPPSLQAPFAAEMGVIAGVGGARTSL
ncbi:hypothetical protein PINS_up013113 [Pythium insidiosum]|nr:hypothetical protein PINS_up013113 [Pythium insidiosum]